MATPATDMMESEKITMEEESNHIGDCGLEAPDDDIVGKKSATFNNDSSNGASTIAVVREWASFTSIHGLPYAADYEHSRPWKRIIWVCLVLVCTGVLIYQMESLISDYLQYNVNTAVKTTSPGSLDFPDVTVCNAFAAHQVSKLTSSSWYGDDHKAPKNEEEFFEVSQSLEEFIQFVEFNKKRISDISAYWKPIITYAGVCFKFSTLEKVSRPGIDGGLQFYANINRTEYPFASVFVGLRVIVTQPGIAIVSQLPFVIVPPATFQYIALERQDVRRVRDKPWSKCNSTDPAYTQAHCRELCHSEEVRKQCNCREWGDVKEGLEYCQNLLECHELFDDVALAKCEEDCVQPPCSEDVFSTQSSTQSLYSPNETRQELFKDGAYVHVNYQAMRKEALTETKEMTLSVLLANIGGQMGLFVGISVISIIEIFSELMIFRLLPRFWGDRRLYGVGSTENLN
jgi:hypothetical protein